MLEHKNLKHSYRKFISNQVSFVLKSSIKLSTGCFKLFQIQFISLFFELHFSTFDVYELSFNGGSNNRISKNGPEWQHKILNIVIQM